MIPNIRFGLYSRIVVIILELKGQKYIGNGKGEGFGIFPQWSLGIRAGTRCDSPGNAVWPPTKR